MYHHLHIPFYLFVFIRCWYASVIFIAHTADRILCRLLTTYFLHNIKTLNIVMLPITV